MLCWGRDKGGCLRKADRVRGRAEGSGGGLKVLGEG